MENNLLILIDDDGPGIPESEYQNVLKLNLDYLKKLMLSIQITIPLQHTLFPHLLRFHHPESGFLQLHKLIDIFFFILRIEI